MIKNKPVWKVLLQCLFCVSLLALFVLAMPEANATATEMTYTKKFHDAHGEIPDDEFKGTVVMRNLAGQQLGRWENVNTFTTTLKVGGYYEFKFTNADGYYAFWTANPGPVQDSNYINQDVFRTEVPITVTVKNPDGTLAANTSVRGVNVSSDYVKSSATTNAKGECKLYLNYKETFRVEAYDGQTWNGQEVYIDGIKSVALTTASKRVNVNVSLKIGTEQMTGSSYIPLLLYLRNANGDLVIAGLNPTDTVSLQVGETYSPSDWDPSIVFPFAVPAQSFAITESTTEIVIQGDLLQPTLNASSPLTVYMGKTHALGVGNVPGNAKITWQSADTDVFTVSAGVIMPVNASNTPVKLTAYATLGGKTSPMATLDVIVAKRTISSVNVAVTAPVGGAAPQNSVAAGEGYTGEISWSPADATFGYNKEYTATIVLTPDANSQFSSATTANGFTTSYDSATGKLTLTKTFTSPKAKITAFSVPTGVELTTPADKDEVIDLLATTTTIEAQDGTTSLPVSWACDSFSADPNAVNTFAWTVDAGELDANGHSLTGTVTIKNPGLAVTHTPNDQSITYSNAYDAGYDVTALFTLDLNAGAATYTIDTANSTGAGSITGTTLTITKAGTFTVHVETEETGHYAPGKADAVLTVAKGTGSGSVSIVGWTYGEGAQAPVPDSATNGKGSVTYAYTGTDTAGVAYSGTTAPKNAGSYTVKATFAETDLYEACEATCDFTIARQELTPSLTGSVTKKYDTTTDVPATHSLTITLSGVVAPDDVSVTAAYAYAAADVGTTQVNATQITLQGADKENYTLATTSVQADVGTIEKADPVLGPIELQAVYGDTLADVALHSSEYAWKDALTTPVGNAGTQTFTAIYTHPDTHNYNVIEHPITIVVAKADPEIGTVTASVVENTTDTAAIVLARSDDTVAGVLQVDVNQTLTLGDNTIAYTFYPNDTHNYNNLPGTVLVQVIDTLPPTGSITLSTHTWNDLLHDLTFGLFFKETQVVTITADDAFSGIASVEYYETDVVLTQAEVAALADSVWTETNGSITVTAEDAKKFIYYARITDKSGNMAYLATKGAEFDTTLPVISGVYNGQSYYVTQKVKVTDLHLENVTVNGSPVSAEFTLAGNCTATYEIVATDKAGNAAIVTVYMKPIASLADGIAGITPENVTIDDCVPVQNVYLTVLQLQQDPNATEAEKNELALLRRETEKILIVVDELLEEEAYLQKLRDEYAKWQAAQAGKDLPTVEEEPFGGVNIPKTGDERSAAALLLTALGALAGVWILVRRKRQHA